MLNIYFTWLSLSFRALLRLSVGRFDFATLPSEKTMRSMYFIFASFTSLISAAMMSGVGMDWPVAFFAALSSMALTAFLLWGLAPSPFIYLLVMLSAVGDLLRPFAYALAAQEGPTFLAGLELGWLIIAGFHYFKFIQRK